MHGMSTRLCAISVDLDEIPNYSGLHGVEPPAGKAAHAVYDVAVDRLEDLARSHEVALTWFAIGADLDREPNGARLRQLAERGDEIGNHTLDHRYDLTRLGRAEISWQVRAATQAIEQATGVRPRGFRAPGYTVTDELLDVLQQSGFAYDSSVFPCPAYYATKAAAIVRHRAWGRRSRALLDSPAVLRAPTRPYRTGRPYWRRGDGLRELPIQVTTPGRLPYIGTTLTLAGPDLARRLTRRVAREPFVNLELHGLDALDAYDGLGELRPHQPDLRVPVARKLEALDAVIETLRAAGHAFVRLDEAAERVDG